MKLTILRKGLILIAVPLLFQLGLIGIVAVMQRQVVEAANSFDHTHEVLAQPDVVLGKLNHLQIGMRGYVLTEKPALKAPFDRGIQEAPATLQKLKSLVGDNPAQRARVTELEAKVSRFLAWQAERIKETQDGNREKAIAQIAGLSGENQMEAIRADFAAFRDEQRKEAAELAAERDQLRQQLQWVLIGGVIASLGITFVLAVIFSRGVHAGLTTLISNAERLGQGRELLPPLTHQDEISQVDEAFHKMVAELARAEQARRAADAETERTLLLLDRARDAVFMFDPDTLRFFYVNRGAIEQVGYTRAELLTMTPLDIKPEFDEATFRRLVAPLKDGLHDQHLFTTVHRRKDGRDVPVEIILQCIPVNHHAKGFVAQVRDITERKRAEETIRLYADVVKSVPIGLVIYRLDDPDDDRSLRIVDANPAASGLLGVDMHAILGKTILVAFPACTPELLKTYADVVRTGTAAEIGEVHYGDERVKTSYWSVKAFPLPDCRVGLAFENIDARKRAEADIRRLNEELEHRVSERTRELSESERRYRGLIEHGGDGVFLFDREKYLDVNPAACDMLGYSRQELLGQSVASVVAAEEVPRIGPELDQVADGAASTREWRIRRKDGSSLPAEVRLRQLPDGKYLAFARDVTERKRAEEAIRQLSDRIESILNSAGEGILGLDSDGRTSFANPAALKMLGRTLEELQAGIQHELIHHSRPDGSPYPRAECQIYRAFVDGAVHAREDEVFWRKDGSNFPVSYTSTPMFEDGKITGAVVVFRDITERKQAQDALEQLNQQLEQRVQERTRQFELLNRSLESAKNQAEQANRAKSDFLSRMSHELRTPLNSILGFGQRLVKSELAERDQHRVAQIVKAGQHLLDLINEILDLARIEAGRLTISPEPLSVETTLTDVLDLVRPLARSQQIDLRLEAVPPGWYVAADKQRLRQVLLNILSNAIKYNRQRGTVTVRCSEPEPGKVRLAVEDTGAGIPTEKVPLLFKPFERLGVDSTVIEGTGLGLSLAQKLVELMSGRISVDSTVGVGTTVNVDLRRATPSVAVARSATSATTSTAPLAGQRSLLYIEDNLANINLVEDILQDRPTYRLLTAMQGGLGLDLVRQHHPDLILLDVHLPDMMGDEFLRRLKADPAIQQIPVVVLSADATARQIKTLQDHGACAYLTKPIDADQFLSTIDGFLNS